MCCFFQKGKNTPTAFFQKFERKSPITVKNSHCEITVSVLNWKEIEAKGEDDTISHI